MIFKQNPRKKMNQIMKKRIIKLTSFILAIILSLPFTVFAMAQGESATNDETDIVYELTELRNEFEKHYLMSDGTVVAATYAEPVNYYDKTDGTWKEIDNTLTQVGGRYRNKGHGGFDVSFRGDGNSGDLVEITVDGHTLSWSVSVQNESGVKDTVKAQANATVKQKDTKRTDKFAADKASSGMRYNSPFSGNKIIDVDYSVSQYKVKEDITIYSSKDANVLQYTYNCGSLTAVLNEDNSIYFLDEAGEAVYTVHKPYMYDSAGNGSYEFDIVLRQRGSVCTVVMVPDKAWLDTAVYPVVIDPTVTNKKVESYYEDTYIHSGDSVGLHSSETTMNIGKKNGVQNYGLVKIKTFPSVPSGSTVLGAQFVLHLPAGSTSGGPFTIKYISSNWTENTVCYNNRPTANTVIASSVPADFDAKTITFDITSHYNMIKAGTRANNGFWIENTDTALNDFNSPYSSECGTATLAPAIIIRYTPASESESNDTMATADEIELLPQAGSYTTIAGVHTPSGTTVDYDYFKFVAPRHGRVEVTLDVSGNSIYNVSVYDENGTLLNSKNTTTQYVTPMGETNRIGTTSFTTTKDGNGNGSLDTYYIRVNGVASATHAYVLTVKYTTAYAELDWQYPLPASYTYVTSIVGHRDYDNEYHGGMDISAGTDVPISAPANATVVKSYYDPDNYGNFVILQINATDIHNNNYPIYITFMHMSSRTVSAGNTVQKGQLVGYVGATGAVTGAHLHMEIYSAYFANPQDDATQNAPSIYEAINPYEFYPDIDFTTPY